MDKDLRVFGEVKPPKKMEQARKEMREYLNKDVDLDAVVILTDGFEWELWVRPRGEKVNKDHDPFAKASLRDPLKATSARNTKVDPVRASNVRERIDSDSFSRFTKESIQETINNKLDIDVAP